MNFFSIKTSTLIISCGLIFLNAENSQAGISISPFVSMNSQKGIKASGANSEKSTIKQRTTYGIKAKVSFFRLLGVEGSIGTNKLETTEKTSELVDEFNEIDLKKELDISTDDPEKEVKITEEQRRAQLSLIIDPSFSIFILRAKAGVQATQRLFAKEEVGLPNESFESPITYKPVAGVGAGIKLGRTMHFMAEYSFFFFKFPETEPFEREVSISFGVNI